MTGVIRERDRQPIPLILTQGIPLLTLAQEADLARRAQAGDLVARNQMVEANIALVIHIAKRFSKHRSMLEDLIQEGMFGLMRAIEDYNPKRSKFATYASWWIKHYVRVAARDFRLIRIPGYIWNLAARIGKLRSTPDGAALIDEQVAVILKSKLELIKLANAVYLESIELDIDVTSRQLPPDQVMEQGETASSRHRRAQEAVAELTDTQRLVLERYFGINGQEHNTMAEIGKQIGRTRERVRQIKTSALKDLQQLVA